MAFSVTLANMRGILNDAEHKRALGLFSRAGLSMDHPLFDEELLERGTKAILKTRDGMLRAAVPSPLGSCVFLNDVTAEEMSAALRRHKEIVNNYPRNGEGLEAFVDASDTGYDLQQKPIESVGNGIDGNGNAVLKNGYHSPASSSSVLTDDSSSDGVNGVAVKETFTGKPANAIANASGPEGVDGLQKKKHGVTVNGVEVKANGYNNGH